MYICIYVYVYIYYKFINIKNPKCFFSFVHLHATLDSHFSTTNEIGKYVFRQTYNK